ncbi:MAG: hypothetical protein H7Z72_04365 [Bacteroidetes bacterium]|nr:hypothetical protein [Fibrella sp.]
MNCTPAKSRLLYTTGLWLVATLVQAQTAPTYLADVRPILTQHCSTPCHYPGGVGPFSLLTYQDVAKRAKFVAKVTQIRYMPPFPADRQFQHYANERGLSEREIETIQAWMKAGAPEGQAVAANQQKSAVESDPFGDRKPDLILRMKQPHPIQGDGREDFRYFHIPTGLTRDVFIEAVEFVPGNRKLLHHSRLMVDTTGSMANIDGMAEDDPRLKTFQQTPLADEFLYGWVPGNDRVTFPAGSGKKLKAGSDLIVNIHYAPSPKPAVDQSEIRLYFATTPVTREVKTLTLNENNISNQPFLLPANTKPTFYISYGPLPETIQLISALPHMHRLGRTVKTFAITPDGDLINFVKIDDWDYNWQLTYQFRELLTLPKGTVILAEATYDNTDQNPLNPNRPARPVGYGWSSTDEMLNVVLYYVK